MNRTFQKDGKPTIGRINQAVRRMSHEGTLPSLHQMELDGLVKYNKNGTYELTEKGQQLILNKKR